MDQKTLAKQMEIIHDAKRPNIDDLVQIGRASCRERV